MIMTWWLYYLDEIMPLDISAYTINDAIGLGMAIAKEILGNVKRYCFYEGNSELIIEYWSSDDKAVKIINAGEPRSALMRYYEAERAGLITCKEIN